ncbi:hypothetical protein HYS54_01600 [Candidatus Micrarchaeota archaeon]|nr:hypothetical protein [Candidatus Micrarchaeota archaeon]
MVLRDDIYSLLVKQFGPKGISRALNEFAAERLLKKKKDLFGISPHAKPFVREKDDRFD